MLKEFKFPQDSYETLNQSRYNKKSTWSFDQLGEISKCVCLYFNSSNFINYIEKLFNISGLIPDPHLFGGGYHETSRGGLLKIHSDNNWDTKLLLHRRVNLILYLNKDWKKEYGGNLELWNKDMTKPEKVIEPIFNRLCLFINHDYAYHGHPDPLNTPDEVKRRSIAMYYYSSLPAPENEKSFLPHSTIYKYRPNEKYIKRKFGKKLLERFMPPIINDLINYKKRSKLKK